jgi:hypothetical protein
MVVVPGFPASLCEERFIKFHGGNRRFRSLGRGFRRPLPPSRARGRQRRRMSKAVFCLSIGFEQFGQRRLPDQMHVNADP